MRPQLALVLALVAPAAALASPAAVLPPFLPGDDVSVRVNGNQNEWAIAANPANPDHLVAGANDYGLDGDAEAGWFVSFDGGATWAHGYIPHIPLYTFSGDPTIAFSPDGATVYYAGLASNRLPTNNGANALFVATSADGGLTWSVRYPFTHPSRSEILDKPWIAVDPGSGDLLLTYSHFYGPLQGMRFAKSSDGGATWSERKYLGPLGQFSLPVAGANGEIFVAWRGSGVVRFAASFDGGATFTASSPLALGVSAPVAFRHSPYPVMDVARGGPHAGRIYLAAPSALAEDYDLRMISSDDGGATWSAAEPIARPGTPLMPWLAIAPDGTIGVSNMAVLAAGPVGTVALVQELSVRAADAPGWTTMITTDEHSQTGGVTFWGDYQGLAASAKGFHPIAGDLRNADACACSGNAALDMVTARVVPVGFGAS